MGNWETEGDGGRREEGEKGGMEERRRRKAGEGRGGIGGREITYPAPSPFFPFFYF